MGKSSEEYKIFSGADRFTRIQIQYEPASKVIPNFHFSAVPPTKYRLFVSKNHRI